ncbi:molybdopterin biosynthesis protein MoeB, partial [Staphylococcus nepalensis]
MSERYSRQILFKHIGREGQEKIAQKHALIIGMGALGTHIADGLVRAGIKQLTIVDRDYIEFSNLQRQMLFT